MPAQKVPEEKDFVKMAIDYANEAVRDTKRVKFNRWMRKAAQRFLTDLERAKDPECPFYFDEWHGNDVCDFLEKLPHVEGKWDTVNVVLHASHVFFCVQLFGFRNQDGTRRFTTALFAVARKNAKSFLCSGILLYCYCCEEEEGPQVISAATTGSQARIVFNVAKRIVEKTKALREYFGLQAFSNAIARIEVGGTFKPINAKASTQDGLNPSHCGIDEVHAHKDHGLLNVLKSAAGARRNPLFLYTTTEGYENPGPWGEIRHFAQQLLEGVVEADHFLAVYYSLDIENKSEGIEADDDFDETKWIKANPLMEVNPLLMKEIAKEAVEARSMPGRHAEFKIKRLNKSSSVVGGWTNLALWTACTGKVDLKAMRKYPCWGGLDLANTRDLASLRLVWDVNGKYVTYAWRFVPKDAIRSRTERGLVPYASWIEQGYLTEAGDQALDYDLIEERILQVNSDFDLQMIGYDPWNAQQLVQKLLAAEVPMKEFIQGPKSYHPAMQALERAYVKKNFVYNEDPVLNWCASNLVARTDVNMNMAPDKKKAMDKIDDMVALLMAIGTMLDPEVEEPAEFQMFFV
jgi:phage terminase large subunit-like protein